MPTSVSIKLLVLPCVVTVTWLLTNSIMAQQSGRATAANSISKIMHDAPQTVAQGRSAFHPKLATLNSLKEFSFDVKADGVVVHASVSMMSRHPGPFHLWRLQVTNQSTDVMVSDVPYLDQQFQINQSGIMNPTFNETIQLPPGDYQFLLTLYRIPDDVEIQELLNDRDKATASTLMSITEKVEVP